MLSNIQSIILGTLQGIAELFPISSLGHSIIIPALLGWHIDLHDPTFLLFLVCTHLATALILFWFFWKDWGEIFRGILRSLKEREIRNADPYAKLGWLLIVSTIPAGMLGLLFEQQIREYFITPISAALFLTLNGVLLFFTERLIRKARFKMSEGGGDARIARLTWKQGVIVGAMQALALFPGFSRTGASLSGGLLVGLSHKDAVRFSFLLATPIIGAAALLKIPELFGDIRTGTLESIIVGSCFSAIFAFLSVKFLTKYFSLEQRTLTPFSVYCVIAGVGSLVYLL